MSSTALRDAIDSGKPFRLRSGDGAVIDVPTRDHAFLNPTGRLIVVFTNDDGARCWMSRLSQRSITRKRLTISGNKEQATTDLKLAHFPTSLAATRRGFAFYVADPISSIHELHR